MGSKDGNITVNPAYALIQNHFDACMGPNWL